MPGLLSVLHAAVLGLVLLPVLAAGVAAQTPATLSISADHDDVDEGDDSNQNNWHTVTYTVTLSAAISASINYRICFTGSAAEGNDYGIIDFTAGNCTLNNTLGPSPGTNTNTGVRIAGETDVEMDETIIATLEITTSPVPGDVTLGTSVHTLTINDDDNTAPTVANAIPNQSATVGTPFSYAFPANTFNDVDSGDTLTYKATKGDGTALPSWLTLSGRTFSGTPTAAGTVSIKVTANDRYGGTVSDTFDITVAKPVVSIARGTSPVTEGTGATFTVSRASATAATLTVYLAVSENTAGGRDYVATGNEGNKQVTIAANQTSATYTVPTQGDNVDEPNGEVTVALRAHASYELASDAADRSASVAVEDDDDPPPALPVVRITGGSAVTEGTGASFTVHRTGATTSALTVLLSVSENTGGGRDYVASGDEGNKQVTIAANQTSATYTVSTQGDSTDEPNGEVTVSIRASSTYAIHATDGEAEVAVNDDDDPPPALPVSIAI